jgi:hypothetical protein
MTRSLRILCDLGFWLAFVFLATRPVAAQPTNGLQPYVDEIETMSSGGQFYVRVKNGWALYDQYQRRNVPAVAAYIDVGNLCNTTSTCILTGVGGTAPLSVGAVSATVRSDLWSLCSAWGWWCSPGRSQTTVNSVIHFWGFSPPNQTNLFGIVSEWLNVTALSAGQHAIALLMWEIDAYPLIPNTRSNAVTFTRP